LLPAAIELIAAITLSTGADARIKRSQSAKVAFKYENPRPAIGARKGRCKGDVIDHIKPLDKLLELGQTQFRWNPLPALKISHFDHQSIEMLRTSAGKIRNGRSQRRKDKFGPGGKPATSRMSPRWRNASLYSGQLVTLYFGLVNLWRRLSLCLYRTGYSCGWKSSRIMPVLLNCAGIPIDATTPCNTAPQAKPLITVSRPFQSQPGHAGPGMACDPLDLTRGVD
jgi:hypothetical protein